MLNPEELLYAETHEWVHVAEQGGNRIATVGISAFAVEALTDLVYIELPEVGRSVSAGESFGEIESVKAVSDLYCPVDGEVIEVHDGLSDNLEALNDNPYENGWMVKIRMNDDRPLSKLLDFAAYQSQCEEEG